MVKRHTFAWKEKEFHEIKDFIERYNVLAVADLNMLPSSMLQVLRKKLKGKAEIKVSKVRVVRKALLESKKALHSLLEHANGSIALIGSQLNPFELYSFIKKSKGNASAKPGTIAPNDIIVPAGDTGLPPGPALSELKSIGLKAKIMGPTISIEEDKVIVKKGEIINETIASVLSKLDIKPIEVKLRVKAALEGNQLYLGDILDIDTEKVFNDFMLASRNALNLSVNIVYPVKQNIELLLQKAFKEAKTLSLEACILNKATTEEILAKAVNQAKALEALVPEKLPETQ